MPVGKISSLVWLGKSWISKNLSPTIIHFYECDLNLLLGLYMQEMDQHCKDNHLLIKASHSRQLDRTSIDQGIIDVIQVEIAMITWQILVRFNNDATAYFDCIMPHLLCLCLRSYQMLAQFTVLLGDLLWYAKYAIKTANGVSKEHTAIQQDHWCLSQDKAVQC